MHRHHNHRKMSTAIDIVIVAQFIASSPMNIKMASRSISEKPLLQLYQELNVDKLANCNFARRC